MLLLSGACFGSVKCKENIPITKFRSLMNFLCELSVPNIEHLQCKDNVDYTSNSSADSFLSVLSDLSAAVQRWRAEKRRAIAYSL